MNYKSYLGKRGYIIIKKYYSPDIISSLKKDLTVTPFVNNNYAPPSESFAVFGENNDKLYIPKFFGLEKLGEPHTIKVPNGNDINLEFNQNYPIRDNQLEPINACLVAFKKTGGGILQLPCGNGKTTIALYLISKIKKKTLVIVHKEFLLNQWKERIEQFLPGARIGIIQQDKVDIEDKDIVLGMLQSISMKEYALDTFDSMGMVIIDECFIWNTKITTADGIQLISEIYDKWKSGIKVYSWNGNRFEWKNVTYAWKKMYQGELLEITINNEIITCTLNHKFLTTEGYVEAANLDVGDRILSNKEIYSKIIKIKKTYSNECYVYDLEVDGNHNFLVGDCGLVVHNCHHLSSQVFSRALRKVNSNFMLGLSATPTRKDGLTKVFKWYLGEVIYSREARDENKVIVERLIIKSDNEYYKKEEINYQGKIKIATMINNITENLNRTKVIVYWIRELVKEGRKILVLSERRKHLEDIYKLTYNGGTKSIGYYVGGMKQEDLDQSAKKSVILGTTMIASEGLDLPGLDTLILATPKSDIVQAVGRILRKKHEEMGPKIIDVVDNFSEIFYGQSRKRLKLYQSRNWIIEDIDVWDVLDEEGKPKIIKRMRRGQCEEKEKVMKIDMNRCMFEKK